MTRSPTAPIPSPEVRLEVGRRAARVMGECLRELYPPSWEREERAPSSASDFSRLVTKARTRITSVQDRTETLVREMGGVDELDEDSWEDALSGPTGIYHAFSCWDDHRRQLWEVAPPIFLAENAPLFQTRSRFLEHPSGEAAASVPLDAFARELERFLGSFDEWSWEFIYMNELRHSRRFARTPSEDVASEDPSSILNRAVSSIVEHALESAKKGRDAIWASDRVGGDALLREAASEAVRSIEALLAEARRQDERFARERRAIAHAIRSALARGLEVVAEEEGYERVVFANLAPHSESLDAALRVKSPDDRLRILGDLVQDGELVLPLLSHGFTARTNPGGPAAVLAPSTGLEPSSKRGEEEGKGGVAQAPPALMTDGELARHLIRFFEDEPARVPDLARLLAQRPSRLWAWAARYEELREDPRTEADRELVRTFESALAALPARSLEYGGGEGLAHYVRGLVGLPLDEANATLGEIHSKEPEGTAFGPLHRILRRALGSVTPEQGEALFEAPDAGTVAELHVGGLEETAKGLFPHWGEGRERADRKAVERTLLIIARLPATFGELGQGLEQLIDWLETRPDLGVSREVLAEALEAVGGDRTAWDLLWRRLSPLVSETPGDGERGEADGSLEHDPKRPRPRRRTRPAR